MDACQSWAELEFFLENKKLFCFFSSFALIDVCTFQLGSHICPNRNCRRYQITDFNSSGVLDLIRQSCAEESQAGSWRHVQVTVGGGGQLQILYNSWTKCSLIQIWAPSPITSMSTNSLCSVGSNGAHVLHKHTCVLC